MKRTLVAVLISISCVLTSTSSCKKKNTDTPSQAKTTKELLIGEWIITHEGEDDNNNGTLEDSEKEIRNGNYHLRFDTDGNAIKTYPANPNTWYNYSWTLEGMALTLKEAGNNPLVLTIEAISDTELRYRQGTGNWYIYKK